MQPAARLESALINALARAGGPDAPPGLSRAMHHAVFPGGARVRPMLGLAIAEACGNPNPALAVAAGAAVEMLHCASLVHDDLPCFDDAAIRRGKASVHRAYGEPLAVLAGDALIVLAFETVALASTDRPSALPALIATLGRCTGGPSGIAAGQAWECEPNPPLDSYHQAKTGALFVAAARCGALAAESDPALWHPVGALVGEAYQVADDLLDAVSNVDEAGKPVGQDLTHGRPNAVTQLGIAGAVARLQGLVEDAAAAVPDGPGAAPLRALVRTQAKRLVPRQAAVVAA